MAESNIEWVRGEDGMRGKVWNPITGCSKVSAGCKFCYAERVANRLKAIGVKGYEDTIDENGNWTGKLQLLESKLLEPLRWRKSRCIFVNSMSDLFHANVPDEWTDRVFAVMALCPQHTFLVLTKRAKRQCAYLGDLDYRRKRWACELERPEFKKFGPHTTIWFLTDHAAEPLQNVWLGVSVEDQPTADERIPWLLQTQAARRFVSYEPALGAVRIRKNWVVARSKCETCRSTGYYGDLGPGRKRNNEYCPCDQCSDGAIIDWLICGGESGPGARPMDLDWARSVRDQCEKAGVAFFMKQVDKKRAIPEDLMTREFPKGAKHGCA